MNILIDLLPETVNIDGIDYEINTNFRTSILYSLLIEDDSLPKDIKINQVINLYYPIPPSNREEAFKKIIWFYRCGRENEKYKGSSKSSNKRILSYEDDAEYIYSAFMSQYGIDLQDIENLHWWKFKSLLDSLNEDNKISKIMGYRSVDLNKIKDKEQRDFYKEKQKFYSLDNKLSEEDERLLEEWNKRLM